MRFFCFQNTHWCPLSEISTTMQRIVLFQSGLLFHNSGDKTSKNAKSRGAFYKSGTPFNLKRPSKNVELMKVLHVCIENHEQSSELRFCSTASSSFKALMNLLFQISASELGSNSAGHMISANEASLYHTVSNLGFKTFLNSNCSPLDAVLDCF